MLAICSPVRDTVHALYAYSLAQLTSKLTRNGVEFRLFFEGGSILPDQRTRLVNQALTAGADQILFLDSDMRFPASIYDRLNSHNKDIVACNYSTRTAPYRSVAFTTRNNFVDKLNNTTGLNKVAAVGMGIMLIDANIFKTISTPWFVFTWQRSEQTYVGEDIFFCNSVADHGYEVYVDSDLSKECSHLGTTEFRMDNIDAI